MVARSILNPTSLVELYMMCHVQRIINAQKSKVMYNFINGTTASIGFNITISNKLELEKASSFLKETYFNHSEVNFDKSLPIY
jgi:hypothetical protein